MLMIRLARGAWRLYRSYKRGDLLGSRRTPQRF